MDRQEVIGRWSEAARYWDEHRPVIERMFAPVAKALVRDAAIGPGQAVLDVATGPGDPSLGIATIVGPAGRLVGVDIVPAMVEAARREAERRGLSNASFLAASADALPFGDDEFDAAVSRFGVMFFPSPVDGVREMLRVQIPGGRLALAAWGDPRRNPFHFVLADILERYAPSPPQDPDAPDAFRFADPGKLLRTVHEAGVSDARERRLEFSIEVPLPFERFWTVRTEMSDTLRRKLAPLGPEQVDEIKREFCDATLPYSTDGGLSFPAEVLVVSGRKAV